MPRKPQPPQPLRAPLESFPFTPTGLRDLADALDEALPGAPPCSLAAWMRGCAATWEKPTPPQDS